MLNYFFKRLKKIICFILILIILMVITIFGIFYASFKYSSEYKNPSHVYEYIKNNKIHNIYLTKDNCKFLKQNDIWAVRINKSGNVVENYNKPREVKYNFEITDVAKFTRYYLNDYPVFTFIAGDGLMVLGYPKNSLDKLPSNYYNYEKIKSYIFILIIGFFAFLAVIYLFYIYEIKKIFKSLDPLQKSINKIFDEDYIFLEEKGELENISRTINEANSNFLKLKNSQSSWLRGISHDIRTPLTKLSWGLEDIKNSENSKEIDKMNKEILKISRLIEDLNLTKSLETLGTNNFTEKDPIYTIRKLLVTKLNENPSKEIVFTNKLNRNAKIKMDEHLFYRMLENILENSIKYSTEKTFITYEILNHKLIISIRDEIGVIPKNVIRRLHEENLSEVKTHGMGLFISKQICKLHCGKMEIKNLYPGVEVVFLFTI